jgi:hypothetical protein
MRAFAEKKKAAEPTSVRPTSAGRPQPGRAAAGFAQAVSPIPIYVSSPAFIRPKLTVSSPGDASEQEADRVAEQVTQTPTPTLQRAADGQPHGPSNEHGPSRGPAAGSAGSANGAESAPPFVRDVLGSPGQAIESPARAYMESRFGYDFSGVRVHADSRAAESARALQAHAYTFGQHVVFGAGQYRPHTDSGKKLLAHELTHTLQSGPGVVRRSVISDDIQRVWTATPTMDALLARLSQADVQGAQADADIDTLITTLLAGRANDLWLAQRIRQGQLGSSARGRPIEAHFVPGRTQRRALVIAGTHGSEVQGIQVARMLLADLATNQPELTVIVVPSLFPDNEARRRREGSTPTNRNMPPPTEDLAAATAAGGGTPVDAHRGRRGRRTRAILPENVMLLQLIERFGPERIISIHGTVHSGAGGVFYDPVTPTAAEEAQARADAHALALTQVPAAQQQTPQGQVLLQEAEARNFQAAMDRIRHRDRPLALDTATQIDTSTTSITGRERRPMDRESDTTRASRRELARRRAHPSVPGNVGPSGNIDTAFWSGGVPGGTSLGQYASGRGISIFTVEPPLNLMTSDYPSASLDPRVDAAERRVELQAYADAVRAVLLGR